MFARTDRLLLRPGWREDAPALAAAIGDAAVARNLARVPHPYGIDDALSFLSLPEGPLPRLLIVLRSEDGPRLAGGIGLHHDDQGRAELGYWIARPYWGRGIATEAGRAFLDAVDHTLRLDRIVAGHMIDNPASGAVLRKLGFRPTAQVSGLYSLARNAIVPFTRYERIVASEAPALAA